MCQLTADTLVSLCQQSRYTLSTPSCVRNADSRQQIHFICSCPCVLVSAKQMHFSAPSCQLTVDTLVSLCQQSRYLYLLLHVSGMLTADSRYTLSAHVLVSLFVRIAPLCQECCQWMHLCLCMSGRLHCVTEL